ncbi:hypothetical protein PR048_022732 [Dryococelus australis]|uniref:Uncharacterized protein n=1 Tax=Dryococelus australis TaxID=614101 RepID=A0ABQ9GS56_9NEOP|nr:hypothetical protein PR048_022732 [Dryococelus australis]
MDNSFAYCRSGMYEAGELKVYNTENSQLKLLEEQEQQQVGVSQSIPQACIELQEHHSFVDILWMLTKYLGRGRKKIRTCESILRISKVNKFSAKLAPKYTYKFALTRFFNTGYCDTITS